MRLSAARTEATKSAPAPERAVARQPAFRRIPSIAVQPTSAEYEPPPVRLGRTEALDRSAESPQPINLSSLAVSSPHDPAEKEATATASKIVRMSARPDSVSYMNRGTGGVFRLLKSPVLRQPLEIKHRAETVTRSALTVPLIERQPIDATIQRQEEPRSATASSNIAANIKGSMSGGEPLPIGVRSFMEPRFGADFSNVRIHTTGKSASLNRQLRARAFTTSNHIFFGADRFKPETVEGKELIAHELTHTIQQGAATQRDVVNRSEEPTVAEREPSKLQRFFDIPDPLEWLAEKANNIMGFRMFTIILGVNPITMSSVDRSAGNILRALIEFMPGGNFITEALDNHGIFDQVSTFVEEQVDALGMTGSAIKEAVDQFIDELDLPGDILEPGATWERAKRIFTDPIDQLIAFAEGVVSGIIDIVKDAILKPLAELAEGTEGYNLLKGVLGKDPITDEEVPRDADTLLGPFLKIIGQGEIWENMKKANAIPRCWAWFQSTMSELLAFVTAIPEQFITAFKSLTIEDIILVPKAYAKIVGVFGSFLADFISWGLNAIWNLLEIIFEVVKPGALEYVKKTGAALKSILKDPLPFVGNLAKAAKLGFQNFAGKFVTHLKAGLLNWLTGSLPGVYIPKSFAPGEIVKFAFSVLGLSWANVRAKLVIAVGEPVVKAMETGFDIVVTLVTQGPAAAWDKIKEQLANLKSMVINGIIEMVVGAIAKRAIPKLVAMFIPGAGFISAIVSIYDMVMVFVNKLDRIKQVVTAFVNSIVAIAAGNIGAAAGKVESILAGLLELAINFLAGFAGLGKIADKVKGIIEKVRGYVDKALDWLVNWVVTMAKKLFKGLKSAAGALFEWWKQRKSLRTAEGEAHSMYFSGQGRGARLFVASAAVDIRSFVASKATEAKKNPAKQAAIAAIGPLVSKIESLQQLPEDQQRAREAEFKSAFDSIGTHLVTLLSESDWGTEANPLPLEYTKRRSGAYPVLFFGPKSANRIPQSVLASGAVAQVESFLSASEKAAWKAKGQKITSYSPTGSKALPDGGPSIGISATYQVEVGKKIPYKPGSTAGGALINSSLKPYGYRAMAEGKDGDHIVEMQIGGPNIVPNLWPLDKGENRSSGAALAGKRCKKPDGTEIGISEANQKKNNKLWLIIVRTI